MGVLNRISRAYRPAYGGPAFDRIGLRSRKKPYACEVLLRTVNENRLSKEQNPYFSRYFCRISLQAGRLCAKRQKE